MLKHPCQPPVLRLFALLLCMLVAACTGAYDEDADKGLSALQQRIDRHIVALMSYNDSGSALPRRASATPAVAQQPPGRTPTTPAVAPQPGWVPSGKYGDSAAHYGDVDSAFASLELRYQLQTATGSQDQLAALRNIREISRLMEKEHRQSGALPSTYLTITRDQFLGAFSPLISYQRGLRPGK